MRIFFLLIFCSYLMNLNLEIQALHVMKWSCLLINSAFFWSFLAIAQAKFDILKYCFAFKFNDKFHWAYAHQSFVFVALKKKICYSTVLQKSFFPLPKHFLRAFLFTTWLLQQLQHHRLENSQLLANVEPHQLQFSKRVTQHSKGIIWAFMFFSKPRWSSRSKNPSYLFQCIVASSLAMHRGEEKQSAMNSAGANIVDRKALRSASEADLNSFGGSEKRQYFLKI